MPLLRPAFLQVSCSGMKHTTSTARSQNHLPSKFLYTHKHSKHSLTPRSIWWHCRLALQLLGRFGPSGMLGSLCYHASGLTFSRGKPCVSAPLPSGHVPHIWDLASCDGKLSLKRAPTHKCGECGPCRSVQMQTSSCKTRSVAGVKRDRLTSSGVGSSNWFQSNLNVFFKMFFLFFLFFNSLRYSDLGQSASSLSTHRHTHTHTHTYPKAAKKHLTKRKVIN